MRKGGEERLIERYHALLDSEFAKGLTAEEAEELRRLGEEIDQFFEAWYRPIIERLEAELERRKG